MKLRYLPSLEVVLVNLRGSELLAYFDREDIRADSFIGNTRHGIEFNINKGALKIRLLRVVYHHCA
ncbi:hypothetical protein O9993_09330 [Vibrio lentus]|nr:hypothetical protein [Vibrio lentus]